MDRDTSPVSHTSPDNAAQGDPNAVLKFSFDQLTPEEMSVLSDCRNGFLGRASVGGVSALFFGTLGLRALPIANKTRSIAAWTLLPLAGYLSFVAAGRTYGQTCLDNLKKLPNSRLSEYANMLQAGTTREEFINALQNPNFMTSPESQVDAGDRYGSGDKQSFSQGPYAQDNGDSSESFADARSRFAQRRPPQADGYGDRQMYKENADTYNINTPMDTDTRNYTDMSHRKEDLDLDSHNTNPYFSLDDDSAQGDAPQQRSPEHRDGGLTFEEIRRRNREADQGPTRR